MTRATCKEQTATKSLDNAFLLIDVVLHAILVLITLDAPETVNVPLLCKMRNTQQRTEICDNTYFILCSADLC